VRIAILVEGKTETAFKPHLVKYLETRLEGRMPRLDFVPHHGRIPTEGKLRRVVENLLQPGKSQADDVIALTDVYTGITMFPTAQAAKDKMRAWVGDEPRFHPHVALHDFEAWLLPYWDRIKELTGSNRQRSPWPHPERVNHGNSPAYRLAEVFSAGPKTKTDGYIKTRDAGRILKDQDLAVAIGVCPELKSFVNTILTLGGAKPL